MKQLIRRIAGWFGVDVTRKRLPLADLRNLMREDEPFVLDVGANTGQTVHRVKRHFPKAFVHSFEPSGAVYQQLQANCADIPRWHGWNLALGAEISTMTLHKNRDSVLSSVLSPKDVLWGEVYAKEQIRVTTVSAFCTEQSVDRVHLLKCDTQGFDLQVLQGAEPMFDSGSISAVLVELNFRELYDDQATVQELLQFLSEREFTLIWIYDSFGLDGILAWADGLFVHRSLLQSRRSIEH